MDQRLPVWAPRVPQWQIKRLYETDARGIYDEELIDEVGYALLARCQSFIEAVAAFWGKVRCPACGSTVEHHGNKSDLLCCPCGWQLTWGAYFATIQHKQLSGAEPVLEVFRAYIRDFSAAASPKDKMMRIDALIHGFHLYIGRTRTTRPVAVNLIEGRLADVVAFLDSLAGTQQSTPGVLENKAAWQTEIDTNPWLAPVLRKPDSG
ncbi:MAG: hypothetical protein ACYC6L_15200 [Anaerolineae bacterium]